MPSQASLRKHSPAEKCHVLDAYRGGRADWLTIAANNGISGATAYRIVDSGRIEALPRGGARRSVVKVTQAVLDHLESYLDDNCTYTMETVNASSVFLQNYSGKKIVVVLDKAPAHRQTEQRMTPHTDLVLLRLAPYSPMCNPIEGWFSVLEANIKDRLALYREQICNRENMTDVDGSLLTIKERTMRFLERAAQASIQFVTPTIATKMELHTRDTVNAAEAMQGMDYGM